MTYIGDVDESSPLLRSSMRRGGRPLHLWAFLLQHTNKKGQKTQEITLKSLVHVVHATIAP